MKMNKQPASYALSLKQTLQIIQPLSTSLRLLLAALAFCTLSASAVNFIWDAGNTNNGATIDPASGGWDIDTTTNINWNNGSSNVNWTQGNTTTGTRGAIFQGPGAADGTSPVAIDGGQVAATNLVINASGYMF